MANTDLNARIKRLTEKTHVLMLKYAAMESECRRLASELAESNKAIELRDRQIAELHSRIEELRCSAALAPERDDVEHTREMIARLVREIDQCILDFTD